MTFKYDFYIKDANPEGVAEMLPILREFYTRYPTGNEVAEALHQLRRELNLIQEIEVKKKRVAKIQQELDDVEE
jgi:hypothetical protein